MDMQQFVKYQEVVDAHLTEELDHFVKGVDEVKDTEPFNLRLVLLSFLVLGLQNGKLMLKKKLEDELKEGEYGAREHPRY